MPSDRFGEGLAANFSIASVRTPPPGAPAYEVRFFPKIILSARHNLRYPAQLLAPIFFLLQQPLPGLL